MSWDKIKHKTYDDSKGKGSAEKWKKAFHTRINYKSPQTIDNLFLDCNTLEELKKKYRKLLKENHPDKIGDSQEAKENTQKIIEAYNKRKEEI